MELKNLIVMLMFLLVVASIASAAEIIYVDNDASVGGDGSSWDTAFKYLQDGLAAASYGDEIRVAQGVYTPAGPGGSRTSTFQLISGVAIKGGYAGLGEPDPNKRDTKVYETILSGDLNGDDGPDFANNGENSYHVTTGSDTNPNTVLDGFSITAGNADGSGDHDDGGGMYNTGYNSSPTVTNCTFSGNSADDYGGGMYNINGDPSLNNCIFTGNSAEDGGGMYNSINFGGPTRPILTNCVFSGNTAENDGGGMWNWLSDPVLTNCTFSDNSAERGGGIFNRSDSIPILTNCILWNSEIYDEQSGVTSVVKYSCIPGWTGDGNIDANPLFIDADGADNVIGTKDDNLRLSFDSPCINVGDNSAVRVSSDVDGNPRIIDAVVDMGAYETAAKDFSLSMWSIAVPEGGSATFTVALVTDPQGEIEVAVVWESGDPDITVQSGGLLKFDSWNYSDPQVVTLAAAEDSDHLNGEAQIQVSALGLLSVVVIANEADSEFPYILYVDADSSGANNGTSWEDAYTDLQDALSFAATYMEVEEIHVAQGTYKPDRDEGNPTGTGLREATFQLISGVAIYGGYGGLGEPEPNERDIEAYETILSGDLNGDDGPDFVNNGENSYHVIWGNDTDGTAVLDGLTVTAGNAVDSNGGGIYNYHGIITLTNCTIAGNYVTCSGELFLREGGGGIYNEQGSMTLTNCTIADNYAAHPFWPCGGGGIHNCEGNMTLTDCAFIGNSTSFDGGGMYNVYGESTLTNCTFSGNSAGHDGGGFSNDYEDVTLANCMFSGNSAGHYGGGLYNSHFGSTVSNCTFIDNTADKMGGGVGSYWLHLNSLTLTNCTFNGNSAGDLGGAVSNIRTDNPIDPDNHVELTNCILWDNSAEEGPQVGMEGYGDLYISYSCLQGGELDVHAPAATLFWDESNIDDNPLFVDADNNDYHLQSQAGRWDANSEDWVTDDVNSPCIDAGDPNSDWTAELWPHGKRINMGAFGGTPQASMSTSTIGNIADLNANDVVNYADLKLFTDGWLRQQVLLSEDLDRDGSVKFKDFAIFAGEWFWEE